MDRCERNRTDPGVVPGSVSLYLPTALLLATMVASAQDPAAIVRKSVERDQSNWDRRKDYTWTARRTERHFASDGRLQFTKTEAWDTVILYGEPYRKFFERNGKPLSASDQRKEEEKFDKAVAKLKNETPAQHARRLAEDEKDRRKQREFLREVPDIYQFRLEREDKVDGHPVWVISATPKPGYQPKNSDAKPLTKVKGRVWIDEAEYQWVKLEAETVDTISFGFFLARLSAGAKLMFEQTRVNDEVWLPKRSIVSGNARLVGVKKLSGDEEIDWTNFRKFRVNSGIVGVSGPGSPDSEHR